MSSTESEAWMAYIDAEVWAVCEAKGFGHQIRRRSQERHKPTWKSSVEGFEWKLIVGEHRRWSPAASSNFDGVYYVLRLDPARSAFVFQHDTHHEGIIGPHWNRETFTVIHRGGIDRENPPLPPAGWLRDHLLRLVDQFGPNRFSVS